jgi:pyruvate/2-oxoglutarate/acetoin dehydrogenase E1 component
MTTVQTMSEAARDGLAEEMARDPLVWALGEDLGRGGIFRQYVGLAERFGHDRIVSTPISEATIMGAGLGAALAGTRPVIEIRIADFGLCAVDELVNQIAKVRYMFGGQAKAPVVVRMPQGSWRNSAAQHSQCLEAWWAHVPGLVVAAPGTVADAKGMLKAAIRCDDPVVLLEPKQHWTLEGEVPDGDVVVPLGLARIARAGTDVTLVTWSSLVPDAEAAATSVAPDMSVEVIDLRTIHPWDSAAVFASVRKTERLVIAHEAVVQSGFGAEILAALVEQGIALKSRPIRVGAARAPVPFAPPLEDSLIPGQAAITAALRRSFRGM